MLILYDYEYELVVCMYLLIVVRLRLVIRPFSRMGRLYPSDRESSPQLPPALPNRPGRCYQYCFHAADAQHLRRHSSFAPVFFFDHLQKCQLICTSTDVTLPMPCNVRVVRWRLCWVCLRAPTATRTPTKWATGTRSTRTSPRTRRSLTATFASSDSTSTRWWSRRAPASAIARTSRLSRCSRSLTCTLRDLSDFAHLLMRFFYVSFASQSFKW